MRFTHKLTFGFGLVAAESFEFQTQMGVQLPDYGEPPVLQPSSGYIPAEPSYPPSMANPRGW